MKWKEKQNVVEKKKYLEKILYDTIEMSYVDNLK